MSQALRAPPPPCNFVSGQSRPPAVQPLVTAGSPLGKDPLLTSASTHHPRSRRALLSFLSRLRDLHGLSLGREAVNSSLSPAQVTSLLLSVTIFTLNLHPPPQPFHSLRGSEHLHPALDPSGQERTQGKLGRLAHAILTSKYLSHLHQTGGQSSAVHTTSVPFRCPIV